MTFGAAREGYKNRTMRRQSERAFVLLCNNFFFVSSVQNQILKQYMARNFPATQNAMNFLFYKDFN
jgi:hypothetical protein